MGTQVTSPATRVNLNSDVVMVDGKTVEGGVNLVKEHTYFMLNKPKGFVCSAKANSPNGKTVMDLFEQWNEEFRAAYPGKLPSSVVHRRKTRRGDDWFVARHHGRRLVPASGAPEQRSGEAIRRHGDK
jgi:hypothetical protein